MIVSGSASQSLAAALATELDEPLAAVTVERFPDGELLAALSPDDTAALESTDRAIVVASTVTSDDHLELLQLQDAVREADPGEVVTVVPYMGYARQDRSFEAGQPISARAVARAIATGADRVLTVNPHETAVCDFFEPAATAIDAAAALADPLPGDLAEPVFLSPDAGAIEIAETVRDAHGDGTVDHFEKTRHSGTDVAIAPSDVAVDGRDVVVVDDIVATGGTMSESVAVLGDRGAARVYVACVHPLLTGTAYGRLVRAGVEAIYGTDTVERVASSVSAAPWIADAIDRTG